MAIFDWELASAGEKFSWWVKIYRLVHWVRMNLWIFLKICLEISRNMSFNCCCKFTIRRGSRRAQVLCGTGRQLRLRASIQVGAWTCAGGWEILARYSQAHLHTQPPDLEPSSLTPWLVWACLSPHSSVVTCWSSTRWRRGSHACFFGLETDLSLGFQLMGEIAV